MTDHGQILEFGIFPTPSADALDATLGLVQLAEVEGLDLVSIQDHPYQARFVDTWTLLSVLGARTSTIKLAPNVASLPLRPPVMLAKVAATLDLVPAVASSSASGPARSGTASLRGVACGVRRAKLSTPWPRRSG